MINKRWITLPVVQQKGQKIRDSSRTFQSKIHPVRPSSNQKGAISGTVCGWHVWILLRIPVARILWDFDFLRGLASGRLDGFSIGRYEKNRESFDLYAVKFESGAMRFWGENRPSAGTLSKQGFHPCPSIIKKSQRRTEIHSKLLKKPLLKQKDDYTLQVK